MNRSYAAVIIVVVLLAIGVIAVSGVLSPSQSSNSQSSTSIASSGSSGPSTGSTGTSSSSSSSAVASGGSEGTFSMLATDPPTTASGVSKIYLQYGGEDVHSAGSAAASGWVGLNSSGTIELTSLVNTTQTIASTKIKSGAYDMVRLDVTSVTVLYNSENYTAHCCGLSQITANMTSQAQVNSSAPSAAVIDMSTVVVNSGNSTQPQFLFSASATAAVVPSSDLSASLTIGAKADFSSEPWWGQLVVRSAATLEITSANMTSNSLSLTVRNTGGSNATLRLVTITPESVSGGAVIMPPTLTGSATFVVAQNGTLSSYAQTSLQTLILGPGVNLAAGSSATLTYSGTIQLGRSGLLSVTGVLQGQQYLVTVISGSSAASLAVVAG
jgi:hypothetical protein